MANILDVRNVSKSYRGSDFALRDISFSLPRGSILGYVGENGAGKTTTIGCILNTRFRDGGAIELFGKPMGDADTTMREDIGVVYDGDNFPGYVDAKALGHVMSGLYERWDGGLFHELLARYKLPVAQHIKTYSTGMRRKLAIAAALSHRPKLLILDEATSGLDPVMRDDILDILLDFIQDEEHAILLSSHITSDLEKVADTIAFLHEGRIVLHASKDDLRYRYAIVRCGADQFAGIDRDDMIAYRRRDYQTDVLVADRKHAERRYTGAVIDAASIDEILLLLVKGEQPQDRSEKGEWV